MNFSAMRTSPTLTACIQVQPPPEGFLARVGIDAETLAEFVAVFAALEHAGEKARQQGDQHEAGKARL